MANSPLLPPSVAVNDPAHPRKPNSAALLEAVLLAYHAALFLEALFKMRDPHDAGISASDARALDTMHDDIYDALHEAIAKLAKAAQCPAKFRNLAKDMRDFFGAECAIAQNQRRIGIIRKLKRLATSDAETYPHFDVMRHLFVHVSKDHAVVPDDFGVA